MNVFVSYSHSDSEFALSLSAVLESDGYEVFVDNKIPIGNNIYRDIGKGLAKADVVIIVISPNSNYSAFVANETVSMLSFLDRGRMPLVIPIVLGKETKIPLRLDHFNYIVIPYADNSEQEGDFNVYYTKSGAKVEGALNNALKDDAIQKIRLILAAHQEKLSKAEKEKKETAARVKTGLSKHIDWVFERLSGNGKRNKQYATGLYIISAIVLVFSLMVSFLFIKNINIADIEIEYLIAYGAIALFIAIILVSISKLLFTLAKSFMVEAIRCDDRIHAISFGKFMIEAYGDEITIDQILQAFSAWNYDNGGSSFRTQSGDDYDPKLSELISLAKK